MQCSVVVVVACIFVALVCCSVSSVAKCNVV